MRTIVKVIISNIQTIIFSFKDSFLSIIDLIPTNNKLKQRSKKILIELAGVTLEEAESILIQTNWNLKHALIMLIANVDLERADAELNKANGVVKKAIKNRHCSNLQCR